jgi:predicted phage terminase large subunit-like protein
VYYKREWFRYWDTKPAQLRIYGASDYAVTEGGGDYTVHLVVGVDPDDNLYVLDLWRGQTSSDKWIGAWLDLAKRWKPLMWLEEQGQIIKSIGPFLDKRMREDKVYVRREQVASAADKATRSRSIQARTAMGKVYFPSKATWLPEFTAELLTFPAGRHDDMVDTLGLIGRMLDDMIPAARAKVATAPKRTDYRSVRQTEESWRA